MAKRNTTKKVLLFIVEGENDEAALATPLENLQKVHSPKGLIRLGVTKGDITSDFKVKDAVHAVVNCVKKHCAEYKLKKSDICKVVLLIDMDGAYVPHHIIQIGADTHYGEDKILHSNPEKLQKTHEHKRMHVNRLIELKRIWKDIPFSVCFVSCNFDHVACGNANLTGREKSNTADEFSKKYHKDANGFFSFFHDPELVIGETYDESWNTIKQGLNSLQRYSNMNVFLALNYSCCES